MVKRKIGDILTLQRGYDLPASKMEGGNVAVVGSNGIIGYHNIVKYDAPCIIVGRSGSVGKVRYYSIPTWPHNTALFVKDFKGNDPLYLYYFLKNLHLDEKFSKSSSVVPSLDRNIVHSLHVQFQEDINEQKNIAKILSAFDIKIALNRQINDNLEAMAHQLYDYWFVQFDFPDENGRPYKSSGGMMVWNETLKQEIPNGWYVSNICKVAEILSGGTPSKAITKYWDKGTIPFFGPTDCNGNIYQLQTKDHITEEGLKHCASSLYEDGTIFITARGSIGKLVIAGTSMAMNQSCYALRSKTGEYEYLFFLTQQLIEWLKAKGNGSVFKSIISSDIEASSLCIGRENIIALYCKRVKPIFKKIKANSQEILSLIKQRDELLPLLMNGQATVNYHLSFGILFVYLFLYSQNMKYIWQQKIY